MRVVAEAGCYYSGTLIIAFYSLSGGVAMLTDPTEIEIISAARQKNVRDPLRSRAHFDNIFADFSRAIISPLQDGLISARDSLILPS